MNKLGLLRSYADGPRIWDATAVLPGVYELADKGLIEPVGQNGAYQLTAAGRAKLAGREGERIHELPLAGRPSVWAAMLFEGGGASGELLGVFKRCGPAIAACEKREGRDSGFAWVNRPDLELDGGGRLWVPALGSDLVNGYEVRQVEVQ